MDPGGPVTNPRTGRGRVLVADDQAMVRSGFQLILEAAGFAVVAAVGDGLQAVSRARQSRPDVCLVDIRMPGLDGIEVTRRLAGPDVIDPIPVVVVTTFDDDGYVADAIAAGASGFLLKDAGPALLVEAADAAIRGDALVSPSITVRWLRQMGGPEATGPAGRPAEPAEPLSSREEEVLRAVARGATNAEVARALHIAPATVKTHLGNLQRKVGARNRVELAAFAWASGRMAAAG